MGSFEKCAVYIYYLLFSHVLTLPSVKIKYCHLQSNEAHFYAVEYCIE
jgi:hypothetical protein